MQEQEEKEETLMAFPIIDDTSYELIQSEQSSSISGNPSEQYVKMTKAFITMFGEQITFDIINGNAPDYLINTPIVEEFMNIIQNMKKEKAEKEMNAMTSEDLLLMRIQKLEAVIPQLFNLNKNISILQLTAMSSSDEHMILCDDIYEYNTVDCTNLSLPLPRYLNKPQSQMIFMGSPIRIIRSTQPIFMKFTLHDIDEFDPNFQFMLFQRGVYPNQDTGYREWSIHRVYNANATRIRDRVTTDNTFVENAPENILEIRQNTTYYMKELNQRREEIQHDTYVWKSGRILYLFINPKDQYCRFGLNYSDSTCPSIHLCSNISSGDHLQIGIGFSPNTHCKFDLTFMSRQEKIEVFGEETLNWGMKYQTTPEIKAQNEARMKKQNEREMKDYLTLLRGY